jgi:hypothetical protein
LSGKINATYKPRSVEGGQISEAKCGCGKKKRLQIRGIFGAIQKE